ncbi:hypothetical protein [Sphingobacterium sp. MYb388]|uniref:hypothetical protein n=1 Tax=Sphingobacterium sp. MYb388 TaxID=2745437 RepID=UPI0030AF51C7
MLEEITWEQYLTAVGIATAAYYTVIGLNYYRKELGERFRKPGTAADNIIPEAKATQTKEQDGAGFEELEELVNGIRSGILEQAGEQATKEQLIEQISARVASFSGLHKPAYRYALTNFIIQHSMVICGVVFSEAELEQVWDTLPR